MIYVDNLKSRQVIGAHEIYVGLQMPGTQVAPSETRSKKIERTQLRNLGFGFGSRSRPIPGVERAEAYCDFRYPI